MATPWQAGARHRARAARSFRLFERRHGLAEIVERARSSISAVELRTPGVRATAGFAHVSCLAIRRIFRT